jgi:hypothetical protein
MIPELAVKSPFTGRFIAMLKRNIMQVILLSVSLLLFSCGTERIIAFEDITPKKSPYRITLNDSSEYRLISYHAACRTDNETLVIYNRINNNTLEIIPKVSVNSITSPGKVRLDSPAGIAISIISVILVLVL